MSKQVSIAISEYSLVAVATALETYLEQGYKVVSMVCDRTATLVTVLVVLEVHDATTGKEPKT